MYIMLLRHAQTEWNKMGCVQGWSKIGLNRYGIKQTQRFCGILRKDYWDLVISSDLTRTIQTARGIAEYLNVPIITMQNLRERNYGELEGLLKDEINSKYPQLNYLSTIPGGESYKSFYKRVIRGFQDIVNCYGDYRLIIVTHNGVLQIMATCLGISGEWDNLSYAEVMYENGKANRQEVEIKRISIL